MNCNQCGLPTFYGATGYAGPMCQCQWRSGPVRAVEFPAMLDEERSKYIGREIAYQTEIESLRAKVQEQAAEIEQVNSERRDLRIVLGELSIKHSELRQQLSAEQAKVKVLVDAVEQYLNENDPSEFGVRWFPWRSCSWSSASLS